MMRAIMYLMILTLAAGFVAPATSEITAVSEPTYTPDPPLPGSAVTVGFEYVFSCPPSASVGDPGSTQQTLKNIEVQYKIGAGSYQSVTTVNPTSCTIQCPQPTPPVPCNIIFTTPALDSGSDCKSLAFQLLGDVNNYQTGYNFNAITIGSKSGSCSTTGGGEKPKEDPAKPISAGNVFDPDQTFRCADITGESPPPGFPGCSYDFSCVSGTVTNEEPIVRCKDCNDCKNECGKACGANTLCLANPLATLPLDCEDCCEAQVCGRYAPFKYEFWTCISTTKPNEQEACACLNACNGECDANTDFCNAITIMRILALLAAAILIAIHGLRLTMSQEPADRKNAKESIWFVILGTIIILIASGLVGYLFVGGVRC